MTCWGRIAGWCVGLVVVLGLLVPGMDDGARAVAETGPAARSEPWVVADFNQRFAVTPFSDKDEAAGSDTVLTVKPIKDGDGQALQATYRVDENGYAGFALSLNGRALHSFREFAFRARLDGGRVPKVNLQITGSTRLRKSVVITPHLRELGRGWSEVRIPLTPFHHAPPEILGRPINIAIVFSGGEGTLSMDDFTFAGALSADDAPQIPFNPLPDDHGLDGGRSITWSGYDWRVRPPKWVTRYPGPNHWTDSADAVWVDEQGRLHLTIRFYEGNWYCSEIVSKGSFGYGRYEFQLTGPYGKLDKSVVIGLFTYLDDNNEIDIEITKWGKDIAHHHEQFTVQPYQSPGHINRRDYPPGFARTAHAFTWLKDRVEFASYLGHGKKKPSPYRTWTFAKDHIPIAGEEHLHLNLWLHRGSWPKDMREVELIVDRFDFTPALDGG